jgi:hypothetical protein
MRDNKLAHITYRQLKTAIKSSQVKEVMVFNSVLDAYVLITKKEALRVLKTKENIDGFVKSWSVELSLGTIYLQ